MRDTQQLRMLVPRVWLRIGRAGAAGAGRVPGFGVPGESASGAGGAAGSAVGAGVSVAGGRGPAGVSGPLAPGSFRASPARFALSATLPGLLAMSLSSSASALRLSVPPRLSISCFALRCRLFKFMKPPSSRVCSGTMTSRLFRTPRPEPSSTRGAWPSSGRRPLPRCEMRASPAPARPGSRGTSSEHAYPWPPNARIPRRSDAGHRTHEIPGRRPERACAERRSRHLPTRAIAEACERGDGVSVVASQALRAGVEDGASVPGTLGVDRLWRSRGVDGRAVRHCEFVVVPRQDAWAGAVCGEDAGARLVG